MQTLTVKLQLNGLAQVQAGLVSIRNAVSGLVAPIAAVAGFAGLAAGMAKVVRMGVGFNSTLETSRLAIAALVKQAAPAAFKDFNAALQASDAVIQQLKETAKTTPAEFEELLGAFQAITGMATQAGVPLAKQVELMAMMAQATAAFRLQAGQLQQESRDLFSGNISRDSTIARALRITPDDIERAKEAGQLFEFLKGKFAAFDEAAKRGNQTMPVLVSNLRDFITQSSAVATLPIFERIKAVLVDLTAFDFEGLGKRVNAGLTLLFASFKDGTFSELLGLSVQAGFELGFAAVRKSLAALFEVGGSGGFWTGLLNLLATLGTELLKALTTPLELGLAMATMMVDTLRFGFQYVGEVFWQSFKAGANKVAEWMEWAAGKLGIEMNLGREPVSNPAQAVRPVMPFGEALSQSRVLGDTARGFFAANLATSRDLLGIGGGSPASALDELRGRIDAIVAAKDAEAKATAGVVDLGVLDVATKQKLVPLLDIERGLRATLRDLSLERARVEGDFTLLETERYAERVRLLDRESAALREIVDLLQRRADLATDEREREQILSRLDTYQNQLAGTEERRFGMGPDPASWGDQWKAVFRDLREMATITAKDVADSFRNVIGSAVRGVSDSIKGLLRGTMDWASALRNIGESIVDGIIDAFADMFAEWIVGRLAVKATEVSSSTAEAAAKAPGAMLTSISSWGIAAAVGGAAFLAAMALAGGFERGGYTGNGGTREPAGVVHGREFVFDAPSTARWTPELLGAMQRGQVTPESMSGGGGPVAVAVLDNRAAAREFMESHEGRAVLLDIQRRQRHFTRGRSA